MTQQTIHNLNNRSRRILKRIDQLSSYKVWELKEATSQKREPILASADAQISRLISRGQALHQLIPELGKVAASGGK